jgi:hypothetical protein
VTLLAESAALHQRVLAFARAGTSSNSSDDFARLALEIADFQCRYSPGFRRLIELAPGPLDRVDRIPAVPTEAFRLARVAVHDASLDSASFFTSGTTGAARGAHHFRTTATYSELSVAFGRRALLSSERPLTVVALADAPGERPSSSLAFMLERFAEEFDRRALDGSPFRSNDPTRYLLRPTGIDQPGLRHAIGVARARSEPLLVLSTSFALVALLDALAGDVLPLPDGSAVMHTGGYKGRGRELDPGSLRASVAETFALSPASVVSEYGMTELSSQLYEGTLPGADLRGPAWSLLEPPWLRVTAVDPVSLEPVADGELGLARFVDLANIDSAVAILTRDLVRRTSAGIELVGRAAEAMPRGCSLAVEALLEAGRAG